MKHRPRKRFGQNFLHDQSIITQIVSVMKLQSHDNVLEIGPGMGALTRHLLPKLDTLTAIEIDRDLQAFLQTTYGEEGRLHLINQDALKIDYAQFGEALRIVGNLPYNISTPLLLHLLSYLPHIKDMHFMLQKEVVQRMAAEPGSKAYGRLSVILQYYCEITYLFDVPPEAFEPAPKVDSAIVRLTPYEISPYAAVSFDAFEKLIAIAFNMRRKTLANNLKPLISAQQLQQLDIDPGLRPEQLSIEDFVKISNFLTN